MYEGNGFMAEISRTRRWTSTLARLTTFSVMAFVLLSAPAATGDPLTTGLAAGDAIDLGTDVDFRIDGAAGWNWTGYSVTGAGDVNSDGRDDVIVGSPYTDNNDRDKSGSAYVIYSPEP